MQLASSNEAPFPSLVVTIDGPAGAGKSTVARKLAEQLGFDFLDTGAMYRCVTLAVLRAGIDASDHQGVLELASHLQIDVDGPIVQMNGEDVSEAIRTPAVASSIGRVADNVAVRRLLSQLQRDWAAGRRVVTEGRDQGSEVFHDSPCKIFLIAGCEERARRRLSELAARGIDIDLPTLLDQQNKRDHEDRSRAIGGLRKAEDAIEFSTDGKSPEQVVEELCRLVLHSLGLKSAVPRDADSPAHRPAGYENAARGRCGGGESAHD